MRGVLLLALGLLVVPACGSDGGARRLEHRAVYATEQGVSELSISRLAGGGSMMFWTEGALGRGAPTWMRVGDTQAHHVDLPLAAQFDDRTFTPLFPVGTVGGGFVIYGFDGFLGAPTLHELDIDPSGGLAEYRTDLSPVLVWIGQPLEAFPVGAGQMGLLGYRAENYGYVLTIATPRQSFGGEIHPLAQFGAVCAPELLGTAAPGGLGIVVRSVCLRDEGRDVRELWASSVSADTTTTIVDDGPWEARGALLDVAANGRGVAVLAQTSAGGLLVYVRETLATDGLQTLVEGLFAEPAWELDAVTTEPRLFATDGRFVVVWNEEGETGRDTRAIVLEPGSAPGEPFAWPLPDDECPVRSTDPQGERLEYVCTARCQGAGCAERWIYRGEIALP